MTRDTRYLRALIEVLDRAHSRSTICTCPEHRIIAAYRQGERQPPSLLMLWGKP